jgi:hypothetical protein
VRELGLHVLVWRVRERQTVIGEALGAMLSGEKGRVLFPYAIEVDEQIIEVYDPAVHTTVEVPLEDGDASAEMGLKKRQDSRWVLCRRPTVFTGGELTLPMLDLSFNPISKYYAAPPQVKSSGGVFIIDDFAAKRSPRPCSIGGSSRHKANGLSHVAYREEVRHPL